MKWILSFQSQKDTQEYPAFCSVLNKSHVNCICVFNDEHKPSFGSKYCTKIAQENESYRSCTWRHTLLSNMYMYKLSSLSYVIFPVFGHSVIIIFILYCWAWKWCSVVYPFPCLRWLEQNTLYITCTYKFYICFSFNANLFYFWCLTTITR